MSRRTAIRIVTATLLTAAALIFRPDRAIQGATGNVAQTLCSEVFVSGLPEARVYAQSLAPNPGLRLLGPLLRHKVDRTDRAVEASWAGLFASRSTYRGAAGCRLAYGRPPEPAPLLAPPTLRTDSLAGPAPVETENPVLKAALDHIFAEPAKPPHRWVRAVVIVHHGRIVAERYAPGIGVDTPLLGYSASKTAINALVGVLVRQGRLEVDAPAPVAAWKPGDPRRAITLDNLLRMTSGLAVEETDTGFDPTSQMLFVEPDMAAFAASRRLKTKPGERFDYASPNTLLVASIIRQKVGGSETDVLNFARRELFDPVGMRGVVFETDAAGTPIGSTRMLAPARDWARLGLLYLHDGVVDGRRILPEGWVAWSTRPTLGSDYGAGLWTNAGDAPNAKGRVRAGMPRDAYFASGRLGQRIYVLPSQDLVIVRMGATWSPDFDIAGDLRLIRETIAALEPVPRP
ncbi:serine hydrolase [Phenylobacterium sp. 20VBR1]|uniref:Serine hydrolase n=2 Tax=Phenylobacterium glaciei TaxID=2803784 RepID=A0A941HWR0_9CAUL|nr:serine hydrolase [Phenylobacterium glaciei]MBR7619770.1 serine hydrolase [Phenylobacterium glaciei]